MNARQRRDARRAPVRRVYARSQAISTAEAMKPAVGRRGRTSYQGSGQGGYRSEWADSATRRDAVTIDRRWDDTVQNQQDPGAYL